jgi:hypothetical protein
MGRALLLTLLAVTCFVVPASSEVPPFMNYQGVLTDGAGSAISDGTYSITFNLYHQESGGSPVWTQVLPVSVSGGIFNVTLGELPPEFFEHPVFLGLSIDGGQELAPRRALLPAPYALNAFTVQDSSIHHFKIAAGTVVRSLNGLTENVTLTAGSNVTITPAGNDITISATGGGGVGGSGAAGQVAFWSGASTLSGENDLFWNSTSKRLGIGTPAPNGRLRVDSRELYTAVIAGDSLDNNTQVLRVNFTGSGAYDATGVWGQSRPSDSYGVGGDFVGGHIGVHAFANVGTQSRDAYGLHAEVIGSGGTNRYGVLAEASGPGSIRCYGILAEASSATANYNAGVYAQASDGDTYRYGLYGYAIAGGSAYFGVVGEADISGTSAAVQAFGDLQYSGSLIGPPSDARLKKEVQPYDGALASIKQMTPSTFRYRTDDPRYEHINMAPGIHYGLIAQDLEKVLPELVVERVQPKSPVSGDDDPGEPLTVKGIKYMELIPILIQAIKEQQETIEELQARVTELEKK